MGDRVTIGTLDELRRDGCLTGKAGTQPVCVFWSDGSAYALDDRCPHMGFPLHRGSVESGLVTCHWHNARFDLSSGGTLDPWADDVRAYPVEIDEDDRVIVVVEPEGDRTDYLLRRLEEGLEQGITLVIAKAVLGLLDNAWRPSEIVRAGVDFGTRYREAGWGAGLTVLTSMANVLASSRSVGPRSGAGPRPDVRVQGHSGSGAAFPLLPLGGELPADRLEGWYRRFIETRSADAAERTLASAVATAGCHDGRRHHVRRGHRPRLPRRRPHHRLHEQGVRGARTPRLGTGRRHPADAGGSDRLGQSQRGARAWRFPHDLSNMITTAVVSLPERLAAATRRLRPRRGRRFQAGLVTAVRGACRRRRARSTRPSPPGSIPRRSAAPSPTPPRCASPGSTRRTITAIGMRCTTPSPLPTRCTKRSSERRRPSCCRGVYHGALRIYLDRFLNVPAARLPEPAASSGEPTVPTCPNCRAAGTRRAASTTPAPSSTGTCTPEAIRHGRSQRSVMHC